MKNWSKLGLLSLLALTACTNEEDNDDNGNGGTDNPTVTKAYVINEGAFQGNNSSISSVDSEGNVEQNLFFTANGEELGDVAQDMIVAEGNGYIVVNNSQKVEVVDLADFSSVATLSLSYPRHAIEGNGRVFVSNGTTPGGVFEVDPASNSIIDSVTVGAGPERMAINGTDLLVANFAWGSDSTISVIDMTTLTEERKVTVGAGPSTIVKDANENIWVLTNGKTTYNFDWTEVIGQEGSKLVQLSGSDYSELKSIALGDSTTSVGKMAISADRQTIYYHNNMVYKMSISATSVEASAFISDENVTGLAINEEGNLVVLTGDYSSNGTMKVYDENGNLVSSHETGIAPNGIAF